MKPLKLLFTLLLLCAVALPARSQMGAKDSANYMDFLIFKVIDQDKQEAALTGYIPCFVNEGGFGPQFPVMHTIVIPQKVTIDGQEYTVVELADGALGGLGSTPYPQRFEHFSPRVVVLPPTIRRLGKGALATHTGFTLNLLHVDFPESVTEIGDNCLASNQSGSVTFPKNLKSLGKGNICGLWMTNVNLLFSNMEVTPQMLYMCESIENLKIEGENITIAEGTFSFQRISSIEFGEYPVTLKKNAFGDIKTWDSPGKVFVRCNEPYAISNEAFSEETFQNATLYVPESALEAYKQTQGWSKFAHVETLPEPGKMVQEGVIWNYYAKTNEDALRLQRYSLRFSGTTTIGGKEYANAYRYTDKTFNADQLTPCAFVRQEGDRIYALPNADYDLALDPAGLAVGGNIQADENGEKLLYDFTGAEAMKAIYGDNICQSQSVAVQDIERETFTLNENRFVQAIGFDGAEDGDLLSPMTRNGDYGCAGLMSVTEDATGKTIYTGSGRKAYGDKRKAFELTERDDLEWTYFLHDIRKHSNANPTPPFIGYYHIRLVKNGEHSALAYRYQGDFNQSELTPIAVLRTEPETGKVYCTPNEGYVLQDYDRLFCCGISYSWNLDQGTLNELKYAVAQLYDSFDAYEARENYTTSLQKLCGAYRRVCEYSNGKYKFIEGLGADSYSEIVPSSSLAAFTRDLLASHLDRELAGGLCLITDLEGNVIYEGYYAEQYRNDLNKDGIIDVADLNMVVDACVNPAALPQGVSADVNRDGCVDVGDLNMLINRMLGK